MTDVYVFAPFTLDVVERRLVRAARAIQLSPKADDLLVALVQTAGRLGTKEQLLASGAFDDVQDDPEFLQAISRQ